MTEPYTPQDEKMLYVMNERSGHAIAAYIVQKENVRRRAYYG
jgi:hypothetical protein